MLNEYRKWLINKGYAVMVNHKPSTVYDYCRALKRILHYENITIEQLAENIADICPLYQKGNLHEVRGKEISRSCRNSLKQFNKFVLETQVVA